MHSILDINNWTLTTEKRNLFNNNIKKRNKIMWANHEHALVDAWENGVKSHIIVRAGHVRNQWETNGYPAIAVGQSATSFMANMIMSDFADAAR